MAIDPTVLAQVQAAQQKGRQSMGGSAAAPIGGGPVDQNAPLQRFIQMLRSLGVDQDTNKVRQAAMAMGLDPNQAVQQLNEQRVGQASPASAAAHADQVQGDLGAQGGPPPMPPQAPPQAPQAPAPQGPTEEGGTPPQAPSAGPQTPGAPGAGPGAPTGQGDRNLNLSQTPPAGPTTAGANQPADASAPPAGDPAQAAAAGPTPPQTLGANTANTGDPTEYEFGYSGQGLVPWARSTFMTGMGENGINMSDAQTPLNPYQAWVKSRYQNQVPITQMMSNIAGDSNVDDSLKTSRAGTNAFAQGPTGSSGGGMGDLRTIADLEQKTANGDTSWANGDQSKVNFLQGLEGQGGAQDAISLALAAYTQKYGNFGADQMLRRLQDSQTQYFGSSQNTNSGTPFLNFALQKTGMI